MMRFVWIFFFLSAPVFAVESSTPAAAPSEERGWLGEIGHDLTAPFRGAGLDTLLIGSGATALAYPFRNDVLSVGRHQPLGSTSKIGYQLGLWKVDVAYFVAFMGYGLIAQDPEARRKATMMARATIYTALVTTGIKDLHFEERPRKNGDMNSFPSGHASNAFAVAGVAYRNHGWIVGAPAFALASFVCFSRLNDNAHYLHDVVFGGTIGLSYALGLDTEWSSRDHSRSVAFVPMISGDAYGAGAIIDF
jgi:membrane-associated phospholipid phosphatase